MAVEFCWSSGTGHSLCRDILKTTKLGYDPHTYQIEGACKALDGVDVFAITPTGSGKTGFYIIYILIILAVTGNPSLAPPGVAARFPSNPCLILICPTITLQVEMVSNFICLLPAKPRGMLFSRSCEGIGPPRLGGVGVTVEAPFMQSNCPKVRWSC